MKTLKIQFLKSPTGAYNLAYNKDDVTPIEEKQALELIDMGYAKLVNKDACTLPSATPCREILSALGFTSVNDVVVAVEGLDELEGLSKESAEKIIKFLLDTGHINEHPDVVKAKAEAEAKAKAEEKPKAKK